MKKIILVAIFNCICAWSQVPTITRPLMNFRYAAPSGWLVTTTSEIPGQFVVFQVKNPAYTWAWYFTVKTADSQADVAQRIYSAQWTALKTGLNLSDGSLNLLVAQEDTITGNPGTYSGSTYTKGVNTFAIMNYARGYKQTIFSYYMLSFANDLNTQIDEMNKVKNGLFIGDVSTVIAKESAQKSIPKDFLLSQMKDALGRSPKTKPKSLLFAFPR